MKKLSLVGMALVAILGLGASDASAQVACVDFDLFCDAIQVEAIDGADIDGTWFNWDCAGSNGDMDGNPIAGGAQFLCTDDVTCNLFGDGTDFRFAIDVASNTFDLDSRAPDGSITNFQTDSPFTLFLGTGCIAPLTQQPNFGPSVRSQVLPN